MRRDSWKAQPGSRTVVADRRARRSDGPETWVVRTTPDAFPVRDQPTPNTNAVIPVSTSCATSAWQPTRAGCAATGPATTLLKSALTYHIPYRAGITYPTRDRLPLVTQPVLICTNEHDVFRPGLPEARQLTRNHAARIYPDPGPAAALAATADLFRRFLADEPLPPLLGEV